MGEKSSEGLEAVISKILKVRPDLTREQVFQLIERKRVEAGNLLNPEGAAFLVASELGVKLWDKNLSTGMKIKDLAPGLRSASLTGRILAVGKAKTFSRPGGREGKLVKLVLGDSTGMVEVYLWDGRAEEAERMGVSQGLPVRVEQAYTRRGLSGRIELHLAEKGSLTILDESEASEIPPLESFFSKPSRLEGLREANIRGVVSKVSQVKSFPRPSGEGKVLRVRILDGEDEATLVFWDEKVEEVSGIKPGDLVEVVNGKIREDPLGGWEIHVRKSSYVRVKPSYAPPPTPVEAKPTPIGGLQPGVRGVTVEGYLVETPSLKEVTLRDGSKVKVAEFLLRDETGSVRVSAWREVGEILSRLPSGLKVRLKGVTVKEGFAGGVEIATTSGTTVEVIPIGEAEG
ncbi:MAG: hypothetical protein DRO52_04340 [Candidatus Hecatellales archaeon]|nr:MAG: hypothetical protein DRO52_04340 [Candidatus Hecatellales archaeon]